MYLDARIPADIEQMTEDLAAGEIVAIQLDGDGDPIARIIAETDHEARSEPYVDVTGRPDVDPHEVIAVLHAQWQNTPAPE